MDKAPWSVPVAVEDIPETGLHMELDAPASTRAEIGQMAALRELPRLAAVFDLTRKGAAVHVLGRIDALVGQTCVVSLEPMESRIDEAVDVTYAPPGAAAASDEEPEPLVGDSIDLGALATEFLLLAINPYPRKEGAKFAAPAADERGEKPFAALETLKKRLGSKP